MEPVNVLEAISERATELATRIAPRGRKALVRINHECVWLNRAAKSLKADDMPHPMSLLDIQARAGACLRMSLTAFTSPIMKDEAGRLIENADSIGETAKKLVEAWKMGDRRVAETVQREELKKRTSKEIRGLSYSDAHTCQKETIKPRG